MKSKTRIEIKNKKVKIKDWVKHAQVEDFGGSEIDIEGYWDDVTGSSWMYAQGNPACLIYAMRTGFSEEKIPNDDEVLYGKIGCYGHLVHISELEI